MVVDPESRPRIAKVWANNFRSIESAELELGPLTVLVGPNASGKSNLMDILWFLGDSARLGLEAAITRGGIDSIGHLLELPLGPSDSIGPASLQLEGCWARKLATGADSHGERLSTPLH